jgi:Tol biopolymer transport system component/DNA-binding winged helix-turn-helix (wHTH) protein
MPEAHTLQGEKEPPVAPAAPSSPRTIRFGVFELDLKAGELRKQGVKVKLQDQPFQILVMLLEHPGEIVTREEIQQKLWPADTFVDFEHGINAAVKRLREALDDSADNPRFVETLARRGYRFIAPVESPLTPRPSPPGRGWPAGPGEGARHVPLRTRAWAAALLVAAIAAAVGIWIFQSRKERSEAPLVPVPLTSYPGYEAYPSFSPDGTQVAFQWCPEEPSANCDIYVKQIGVEPPFRLTTDPAEDFSPAWSPDGQFIAFLRKLSATRTALMLIPQRGGQERLLAESDLTYLFRNQLYGHCLAWTPDSKWLVLPWGEADKPTTGLFLLNVETRETRRLTTSGDTAPAFSPDGRTLAFNRGGDPNLICFLHLTKDYQPEGEPEQVAPTAEPLLNFGTAWSPDGRDIVFSSGRWENSSLWRVEASTGASPRRLAFASEGASVRGVSRQGNRLAYAVGRYDDNIWRVDLRSPGRDAGIPTRLIASTRKEEFSAYAPDGKRIAFMSERSGAREIWVCGSDGSNSVQLTAFGGPVVFGPKWSPDGQKIAFFAFRERNGDVYVVSTNGGPPRRLTSYPGADKWPCWSRDGQSIYFNTNRNGGDDIWKMPATGGEAVRITQHGGDAPQESPDGRFVYYEKGWPSQCSVWRVPAAGGEEVMVLDSTHPEAGWTVGKQGIYYFTPPDGQGRSDIRLYKFATGKTIKLLTMERNVGYAMAVSPDERTILYTQFDQAGSDLMLVENFR